MYHYTSPRSPETIKPGVYPTSVETVLSTVRQLEASYGLQPFTLIHVEDHASKKKVEAFLSGEQKIPGDTSLIVLAIRPVITKDLINDYITDISVRKKISRDSLNSYRKQIENTVNNTNLEGRNWSEKQAYIALDLLLAASKELHVHASILQDMDAKSLDKLLELPAKGLHALLAIALSPGQEKKPSPSAPVKNNRIALSRP
jgi:nitroreductase / dihydropteridine reductase